MNTAMSTKSQYQSNVSKDDQLQLIQSLNKSCHDLKQWYTNSPRIDRIKVVGVCLEALSCWENLFERKGYISWEIRNKIKQWRHMFENTDEYLFGFHYDLLSRSRSTSTQSIVIYPEFEENEVLISLNKIFQRHTTEADCIVNLPSPSRPLNMIKRCSRESLCVQEKHQDQESQLCNISENVEAVAPPRQSPMETNFFADQDESGIGFDESTGEELLSKQDKFLISQEAALSSYEDNTPILDCNSQLIYQSVINDGEHRYYIIAPEDIPPEDNPLRLDSNIQSEVQLPPSQPEQNQLEELACIDEKINDIWRKSQYKDHKLSNEDETIMQSGLALLEPAISTKLEVDINELMFQKVSKYEAKSITKKRINPFDLDVSAEKRIQVSNLVLAGSDQLSSNKKTKRLGGKIILPNAPMYIFEDQMSPTVRKHDSWEDMMNDGVSDIIEIVE